MKDVGNSVSEQRNMPKNQSGKMVISMGGRTDASVGRAEQGKR